MRKSLIPLAISLILTNALVFAAQARQTPAQTQPTQVETGSIYGKIVDKDTTPLPGVTVTLLGTPMGPLTSAPPTTVTDETGRYRFPNIPPGSAYVIKAELQGFKNVVRHDILVTGGANTEVNLSMQVKKLEEDEIMVLTEELVVDITKLKTATPFDQKELQSLPTTRDPWAIMQLAPAILLDRENVGGNESGQQAGFLARGGGGADNLWLLDGTDITDPVALGESLQYYDFDTFEEIKITTGGAPDVTIQTGGIALNMVTRRGANKMSLAGRFYLTDNFFQSKNLTPELQAQGILNTNKIQQIKDYGFNAGGPLIKDKIWWWGSYGVQDIFVYTLYGTPDKTLLNNYSFKLNAQLLAYNYFEAFIQSGAKEKFGLDASAAAPEGSHMTGQYHWGNPVIRLQDEQSFGNNLYVSLKYSLSDGGFGWKPMVDEGLAHPIVWDNTQQKYVAYGYGVTQASWPSYQASRTRNNFLFNANYFNDTFLGLSHEILVGAEYSHKVGESRSGEFQGFLVDRNYNSSVMDPDHDGTRTAAEMAGWQRLNWQRDQRSNGTIQQYAFYIRDTITKGDFTVTLGLRYDKQVPGSGTVVYNSNYKGTPAWDAVFAPATSDAMLDIIPPVMADPIKGAPQILDGSYRAYEWNTWSPRIGVIWDIGGDRKTLAKLALSQYGDVMGVGAYVPNPIGTGGYGRFWWMDGGWGLVDGTYQRLRAADGQAQLDELFWHDRAGAPNQFIPYRVYDDSGQMDAAVLSDIIANGYASQPFLADMLGGPLFYNPMIDYMNGATWWAESKGTQSSPRTREILLTLEREILPDFAASVTGSFRRYDKFDYWMAYYPAMFNGSDTIYNGMIDPGGLDLTNLIIDPRHPPANGPWYVEAGTIPSSVTIAYPADGSVPWGGAGDVTYPMGGAAGRPFYLPASYYPVTGTPYQVLKKGTAHNDYMGLDLVLAKRLSHRWFMNASFTWQNQKSYWGADYLDPTNQWMSDGQPYGQLGGGSTGKVPVHMYARWMAKLSGLYQLPYGFDISGTVNAREGWKIPHYVYMELDPAEVPNPAYYGNTVYTEPVQHDSLATLVNVSFRLEKKIKIGAGRLYFMADVFNLFNAATVNRAYDAYMGATYWTSNGTGDPFASEVANSYNSIYRRLNEILNPRVWRFGMRFEF